jgi:ABC-type bacteriocin/lantibiotic exporter with double-glycine peptidase domain
MNKNIKIKQHDISDCGAACLASVSAHHGYKLPISRIRQYAGTDKKGTNLAGMLEASEKLGFIAKAVRVKKESLNEVPFPAIAHLTIKENWHHFVVVYRVGKRIVQIMDPASGSIERWNREKFDSLWTGILLLVAPSENFRTGNEQVPVWQRFMKLIKPHRSIIIQAGIGAIFYSILGLSTSVYVEKLIDYVIPSGNTRLLNLMSLGLLMLLVFRISIGLLKSVFMLHTGQKIDALLILGYYRHLMNLPQRFFETMRTGEIISRVNDAVKIRAFINNVAVEILVNLLILIFTLVLMLIYSAEMAARMAVIIPLFLIIYLIYNKLNKKYLRLTMEQSAELESQLVESLNAISTIKRFNTGWKENLKFEFRFIPLLKSSFTANKNSAYTGSMNELLSGTFLLILLWSGTFQVFRQQITPGELMSLYALFGYMLGPLNSLIQSNRFIQDALIAADRLFQILDLEQENDHEDMIDPAPADITKINFDKISFRYGSGKNLFTRLDLQFEMKKINGISGDSGSGKSTLLSLLQGIYPLSEGRIVLGNYDLSYLRKSSLSRIIACVPQKTDIFNGSVAENIALSDQLPDMSKVVKVCTETGIMEMVENLPFGLMTLLGENGVKLSGGELQKIAIARAVYRDPEILLFDEPSASMDKASEEQLKMLILKLKEKGKTIILVSHRTSTLEICDKVQYLKDGMIVQHIPENAIIET